MSGFAWVTLATNDSYSLGALVLAHSLKKVNTAHKLVVLITPTVSQPMRNQLETVFDLVKLVEVLDSKDEAHLALLNRPELGITFTKLHCWRLTQFEKCVFVDADTLVVRNCDDLFEREELSAAPDFGWPDCFNSGVFVFKPSVETFDKILKFAVEKGSYDGGDQGLLNQYFTDWTKDINKHLPFVYNLSSVAAYSYYPAFKQFGSETRIFHYIGTNKPWLQNLNPATRTIDPVPGASYLTPLFQKWWDIFCEKVLPSLDKNLENFNGMSLPPEAWTNHVAVEINLETQKLSPQTEPCPPHQATDDFRQFNLPYRSFDVKSPSGTLLNVGFSMDQAFAPIQESKEVREIEEKSEPDQKKDEKKEENEKKEEDKEEKKEEIQKEPEVPKGPFDHETFFPDEKCVSDYMQQNVMLYQLFGDLHCQQVTSSENKFENYVPEQQHIDKNCEERSEETVPSLPRFLTIPENDERQSGNVKVTEKLKVDKPVEEKQNKNVSEQHSEKQIVVPIAPIAPVIPEAPITHVAPFEPVAPVEPVVPVEPIAPVAPVTSVICAPFVPVVPTEPIVPIEPVAPIAPSSKTESPVAETEKSKPKNTIKKFLFDVTKFGSAVKTSVRTFQTNSNDNPAKKFSMPKLKPLLPKKNLNQKPAPAPFSQITAYTEFIMSSDYKEPADLPNDKVGFVQTQISKKTEVTKKKEEKFGPLPYTEKENKFESPRKEEPELEKIQPELYDLRFCKRQMGNKPKPKDTKERSEGKFLMKPWKGKKSLRNKKRAKESQVKEKTRKSEEPKLKTSNKSKSETKTTGKIKDNKKETNNNTNDLEHILNRLRNFSKNYLHFFKETNEKMKSVPNFGYENGLASPVYNKPLVIEETPDRRNIGV